MENASKALIIAGAILVSLIIIALGVLIVNRMSSTVNKASLNSEEAQAHNSKFDSYFGKNVSATEVKQLLKAIAANNVTAGTSDELKKIYVQYAPTNGTLTWEEVSSVQSKIKSGYTYNVFVKDDSSEDYSPSSATKTGSKGYYKSGFIQSITIEQQAKGSGV